jgi:hypothetical protein
MNYLKRLGEINAKIEKIDTFLNAYNIMGKKFTDNDQDVINTDFYFSLEIVNKVEREKANTVFESPDYPGVMFMPFYPINPAFALGDASHPYGAQFSAPAKNSHTLVSKRISSNTEKKTITKILDILIKDYNREKSILIKESVSIIKEMSKKIKSSEIK